MSGLVSVVIVKERFVESAVFYATTHGLMKRYASLGRDSVSTCPSCNGCALIRKKRTMESYSRWQRQHCSTQGGDKAAPRAESLHDRTAIYLLEGTDMLGLQGGHILT